MTTLIRNHPAVFIAAVNGLALGGGVTLVNVCDLAIISEDAKIGVPQMMTEFDLMMKCDMCFDRTSTGRKPMYATVCPSEVRTNTR